MTGEKQEFETYFFQNREAVCRNLYDRASEKAVTAYAPYSGFHVGAALLCKDGTIFEGINIENAAFGAGLCAERTAAAAAINENRRDFLAIAVAAVEGGVLKEAPPCGICRQFLYEFGSDLTVVFGRDRDHLKLYCIDELLPEGFRLEE